MVNSVSKLCNFLVRSHLGSIFVWGLVWLSIWLYPARAFPSYEFQSHAGWIITIVLTILMALTLVAMFIQQGNKDKVGMVIPISFILFMSNYQLVNYGTPSLLLSRYGEPYSEQVTVKGKNSSRRNYDGCRLQLELLEHDRFSKGHLCVRRQEFNDARLGDMYQIFGHKAWFAQSIEQFAMLDSSGDLKPIQNMPGFFSSYFYIISVTILTLLFMLWRHLNPEKTS